MLTEFLNPEQWVMMAFLAFCRLGSALMLMPGFANARVPMKLRLFLGLALTCAALPLLAPFLQPLLRDMTLPSMMMAMLAEMLIGASFGVMVQVLFWAVQFIATITAMSMGFSGQPGVGIFESTPETPLANIIALGALACFFALDAHLIMIEGLISSYSALPPSLVLQPQAALIDLVDTLSKSFLTILRMGAPFLIYAILINFATGLINRLTPNIPVYFISLPFVMTGGLALLYFLLPELLHFFSTELMAWLGDLG